MAHKSLLTSDRPIRWREIVQKLLYKVVKRIFVLFGDGDYRMFPRGEFMRAWGARRCEKGRAYRAHHTPKFTFAARAEAEGSLLPRPFRSDETTQAHNQPRPPGGVLNCHSTL